MLDSLEAAAPGGHPRPPGEAEASQGRGDQGHRRRLRRDPLHAGQQALHVQCRRSLLLAVLRAGTTFGEFALNPDGGQPFDMIATSATTLDFLRRRDRQDRHRGSGAAAALWRSITVTGTRYWLRQSEERRRRSDKQPGPDPSPTSARGPNTCATRRSPTRAIRRPLRNGQTMSHAHRGIHARRRRTRSRGRRSTLVGATASRSTCTSVATAPPT